MIAAAKPAPAGGAPQESLDATGKMKKRPKEKSGKDKSGKGKKDRDVKAGGKAKKDKKSRKGDQPVQVPQQNAPAPESASVAAPVLTITTAEPKRAKKSDDLKEIKGIGPKYEKMLNNLGYRRFKHIAAWTEADSARMQEVMPNFDNRIRSENWIGQAAELAARTGKDRK
ncbi:MAG: hypothetical protein P3W90_002475 [Paracoccus sp. (in: a-proteobacteria)]|nr:hypothetical protein [Paracoccus sp. (in: a-proteobacteria)]